MIPLPAEKAFWRKDKLDFVLRPDQHKRTEIIILALYIKAFGLSNFN